MSQGINSLNNRIDQTRLNTEVGSRPTTATPAPGFRDSLIELSKGAFADVKNSAVTQGLKFSNHAIDRMQARGIRLGPEMLDKMQSAMQKASAKGAKETLMLTDEAAFIVNIKNNTVVTAMDKSALKENVFTNIDSTVVL